MDRLGGDAERMKHASGGGEGDGGRMWVWAAVAILMQNMVPSRCLPSMWMYSVTAGQVLKWAVMDSTS